jgi:hypothetical protein
MMDKQTQAVAVHLVTFGKRKRLADKAAHALPQGVVPSLYMVGLATLLANSFMLLIRQHFLIRLPKVAVQGSAAVAGRNPLATTSDRFSGCGRQPQRPPLDACGDTAKPNMILPK